MPRRSAPVPAQPYAGLTQPVDITMDRLTAALADLPPDLEPYVILPWPGERDLCWYRSQGYWELYYPANDPGRGQPRIVLDLRAASGSIEFDLLASVEEHAVAGTLGEVLVMGTAVCELEGADARGRRARRTTVRRAVEAVRTVLDAHGLPYTSDDGAVVGGGPLARLWSGIAPTLWPITTDWRYTREAAAPVWQAMVGNPTADLLWLMQPLAFGVATGPEMAPHLAWPRLLAELHLAAGQEDDDTHDIEDGPSWADAVEAALRHLAPLAPWTVVEFRELAATLLDSPSPRIRELGTQIVAELPVETGAR